MKYWVSLAVVLAIAASLLMNGDVVTVAIIVNLAIWGILGVALWGVGKCVFARKQRR